MFGEILSAVGNFLGQQQTNQKSWDIAQSTNAASAEQAQKQMDFQKEMRASQYQTAVKDMQSAGLNPMLAYSQGGAGTPAGAVGQVTAPQYRSPISSASAALLEAKSILANVEKTDAETTESISRTGVNDENRKYLSAQTALAILEAPNVSLKGKQIAQQILLDAARTTHTNAMESAARLDTIIRKTGDLPEAESKGKYHKNTPYNPYMFKDVVSGVTSAAGAAKGTPFLPYNVNK